MEVLSTHLCPIANPSHPTGFRLCHVPPTLLNPAASDLIFHVMTAIPLLLNGEDRKAVRELPTPTMGEGM